MRVELGERRLNYCRVPCPMSGSVYQGCWYFGSIFWCPPPVCKQVSVGLSLPFPLSSLADYGYISHVVSHIICEPVCLFTTLAHDRDGRLQRSHFFVRPWAPLAIYLGTAAADALCPRADDAQHPKCGVAVALAYMIVQDQV